MSSTPGKWASLLFLQQWQHDCTRHMKIFRSNTVIRKNRIKRPWEFSFFFFFTGQITYSNLYCSGICFNTMKWWGVFRPSRKGLLFMYSLNKHFFAFGRKNCSSAIFGSYFVIASKIFCRFNFSSPANRSVDISHGGKFAEASLIHHSLRSRSKGAWWWTFSTLCSTF